MSKRFFANFIQLYFVTYFVSVRDYPHGYTTFFCDNCCQQKSINFTSFLMTPYCKSILMTLWHWSLRTRSGTCFDPRTRYAIPTHFGKFTNPLFTSSQTFDHRVLSVHSSWTKLFMPCEHNVKRSWNYPDWLKNNIQCVKCIFLQKKGFTLHKLNYDFFDRILIQQQRCGIFLR